VEWRKVSATINSNVGSVVAEIVAARPDVVAATAWLFTHEVLLKITARVKALLPECTIIFGGPEMLGDNEEYLRRNRHVACVFRGEGELGFHEWLGVYDCPSRWNEVVGLCWLDAEGVYHDGIGEGDGVRSIDDSGTQSFFRLDKAIRAVGNDEGVF